MTTTVLMETLDAPMQDFADADMAMYLATSESWAVEADMTDVDYKAVDDSIEVDMDNQDEEMTEYDMQDHEPARDGDTELVDVDVLDATNSPALPPVVAIENVDTSSTMPLQQGLDMLPIILAPAKVAVDVESLDGRSQDQHHIDTPEPTLGNASLTPPSRPLASTSELFISPSGTSELHAADTGHMPEQEQALELGVDSAEEAVPQSHHEAESASYDGPRYVEEGGDDGDYDAAAPTTDVGAASVATAEQPLTNGHIHEDDGQLASQENQADEIAEALNDDPGVQQVEAAAEAVGPTDEGEQEARNNVPAHGEAPTAVENAAAEDVNDPHEISEGIYIDPPPAVLLSIALTLESLDCVLFNQPSASGSQTPSGDTAPHAPHELDLLLHHRPTLYYEPLSSLFQALRDDDYLAKVAQLEDGELVLDAYDLQLVLTEDNVHAHEMSLHDLDTLHDSLDQSGPLRLQLRLNKPRFITRYYALREQITQLNIAMERQLLSGVGDTEENPETYEPQNTGNTEAEYKDEMPTLDEEHDAQDDDDTGGAGEGIVQRAQDQQQCPVGETDESYQEETPVAPEDAPEGDLDADGHRYADSESGEYDDYAQAAEAEDDDKRFGEELSSDLGGITVHEDEQEPVFGDVDPAEDAQHVPPDVNDDSHDTHAELHGTETNDELEDTLSRDAGETAADTDFPAPVEDDPELYDFDGEGTMPAGLRNSPSNNEHTAPFEHESLIEGGTYSCGADETETYPEDHPVANDGLDDFEDFDNVSTEDTQPDTEQRSASAQSTKLSKRTFDDIYSDEGKDEDSDDSILESPNSKRLRVQ